MSTESFSWYIRGEGNQPAGPFTADDLMQSWQSGRLDPQTPCWREGMPEWLPFAYVEPFSLRIRKARQSATRRMVFLMTATFFGVLLLAAAGYAGYVYWDESNTIAKAKADLERGDYKEAAVVLKALATDGYFCRGEAAYLLAVAPIKQYAASSSAASEDDSLEKSKKALKELFAASDRWRPRAKSDLVNLIGDARDLRQALALAMLVEDLKVAENAEVVKQLLDKVKSIADKEGGLETMDAAGIAHILTLAPSSTEEILSSVLGPAQPPRSDLPTRLRALQRWASQQPSVGETFAPLLFQRSATAANSGEWESAEALLGAAESMSPGNPDRRREYAEKRIEWFTSRLDAKEYAGALALLEHMRPEDMSATSAAKMSDLCLEASRALRTSDRNASARFYDAAFRFNPELPESDEDAFTMIGIDSPPSTAKLERCERFLGKFPNSKRRKDVQLCVLKDASGPFSEPGRRSDEARRAYLNTAKEQAEELMEKEKGKQPTTSGLDSQVWVVVKLLAGNNRRDDAVNLGESLVTAWPETSLKDEIERELPKIRQMPETRGPRVVPPGGEGAATAVNLTLQDKLRRHKRTINTSSAVYDAVNNKEIKIIEVVDTCTADQFDAEQTRLLRNWVLDGGVLWVNNNVLDLFHVGHSTLSSDPLEPASACEPAAGNHPIVAGVKSVRLNGIGGKSHTLVYKGVIPLLALKGTRIPGLIPTGDAPGTTVWSLVPFGKGWISDPKPLVRPEQRFWAGDPGENALFWSQFCQFCLHEISWPSPPPEPSGEAGPGEPGKSRPSGSPGGLLTGTWQDPMGDTYSIDDDGKKIAVHLKESDYFVQCHGTLTRRAAKPGAKTFLDGTFSVTYAVDRAKRAYTLRMTARIDDSDNLFVRCVDECPRFDGNGNCIGKHSAPSQTWTRSGAGAGTSSKRRRGAGTPGMPAFGYPGMSGPGYPGMPGPGRHRRSDIGTPGSGPPGMPGPGKRTSVVE